MGDTTKLARFERAVLVHLDAAYGFARWLVHDEAGAEDAVQDACLRAYRFFESQQGASPRAWFMAIVRNACFDWIREHRRDALEEPYDDEVHGRAGGAEPPEAAAARASDARWLHRCIAGLPREYREVLVLRELEELSYREISAVVGVPLGTVMSRLARGRDLLQERLSRTRTRSVS